MALSNDLALATARDILSGPRVVEGERLARIATALSPLQSPAVELPAGAPARLRSLAVKAKTNYLPLILDVLAQTLIVDGYRGSDGTENAAPWGFWQANGMDKRQTGIHRAALAYGASYATVLPGDTAPAIRGKSPRRMTAVYQDPDDDDWPMFAVEVDGRMVKLYDEEQVYYLGDETPLPAGQSLSTFTDLRFIEARPHGSPGVCPVVRYRDRWLLDDEQFGVIEPLITIQQRVDETTFGLLVAQYYAAFKQRAIIGWVPQSEAEELKASASQLWTFEDPDVKVAELSETALSPYLESKDSAVGDMATIGQVPKQNLGVGAVSNMSAEALAAMEASKERKGAEMETSLGESHEQTLKLAAHYAGDIESANDQAAQVRWKDSTARSFAQMVDGLGKMVTMLGVPAEAAWERIPGVTDTDVTNWKAMRASADTIGGLASLLTQQADGLV